MQTATIATMINTNRLKNARSPVFEKGKSAQKSARTKTRAPGNHSPSLAVGGAHPQSPTRCEHGECEIRNKLNTPRHRCSVGLSSRQKAEEDTVKPEIPGLPEQFGELLNRARLHHQKKYARDNIHSLTTRVSDSRWQRAHDCNHSGLQPITVETETHSGCSLHPIVRCQIKA
jgi:hypothetical protein